MLVRLNKFMARRGVASRRHADRVAVDGKNVRPRRGDIYLMLNKPAGFLVTLDDPFGRKTIRDLLPDLPDGVFPVGRLDKDSEGLLLLTNDGELAFRLTHPRFEAVKRYVVRVSGDVEEKTAARLAAGVFIDGRRSAPARVAIFEKSSRGTVLQIEIHEGRNREVRRMLEAVGHPVRELKRVMFAGLFLSRLAAGRWRSLTGTEIGRLKKAVGTG